MIDRVPPPHTRVGGTYFCEVRLLVNERLANVMALDERVSWKCGGRRPHAAQKRATMTVVKLRSLTMSARATRLSARIARAAYGRCIGCHTHLAPRVARRGFIQCQQCRTARVGHYSGRRSS